MLHGKKYGPGTFVNQEASYRMEGIWVNDDAFAGIGQKEFNDGTIYKGRFEKGKYHPEVRTKL